MLTIKMAWRNIWRNSRRAFITVLAILFAAMLTVVMRGIQVGTYDKNIIRALEMYSGYMQIQVEGYKDNPSLQKSFNYSDKIKQILNENENVEGYCPRIMGNGLIGNEKNSFGAMLFGIDPRQEVTKIADRVNRGEFLKVNRKHGIVLGYKLIKNLNAKIGDNIVILANGYDGSMGNREFTIIGTSKMGKSEFDRMSVFMTLDAAQELLAMGNRVNAISIILDDVEHIPETKNTIDKKFGELNTDKKLTSLGWQQLLPDLNQSIQLDNISGIIYLAILLTIVGFGILNTVTMSVTERFNEFGIMLALGVKNAKLALIVFLETLTLTLIGVFAGMLLGFFVNYYFVLNPLRFGGEIAELTEQFGFEAAMYSTVEPGIFITTLISIMSIAVFVYIFPCFKLLKLKPLKGIRYT